ncbi:hypothetical protein [Halomonas sp. GFAJ-1]|uniref:hypothetical protein n=1 Tax=Halomonas sp. GFAJ-1 TaxID=1118153 RepID=UPI00023A1659|nr:hypothetical protein [Halomonas sp. GFAJ-1]EHK62416.1 hypothetical protein MOY_01819 [Halomonas sp. GFAJ-1]
MKIYWTLKQIPELSSLSSRERGKRWRKAYKKSFRHWETWLGVICCGLCGAAGAWVGDVFNLGLLGAGIGGAIGGLVFSQAILSVVLRRYRDILRGGQLGKVDEPVA